MIMMLFYFIVPFILQNQFIRVDAILMECNDAVSLSMAVDGSLYVCDRNTNSIKRYANGIVTSIGGLGWSNDGFDNPTDISTSFLLDIYVTDKNNNRIQRFDKNMVYIESLSNNTLVNSDSFYPQASALSSQGDRFVLENDKRRVLKIDRNNSVRSEFAAFTNGPGALIDPKDISVTPDNEVIVLDKDRIVIYDVYGNYLRTVTLPKSQEWHSIYSNTQYIAAVSSQKIVLYTIASERLDEIVPANVLGFAIDEFRDVSISETSLFILTAKALLRCSIVQN